MSGIDFKKITLENGMDVILHQDKSIPMVAVNVWYHVGSKDEELGKTGFAHLFEHMMFEGSKHHNENHFEPLQKVGANLNGSTTMDRTNYWETLPSNYLELALWLESDRMGYLLDALTQERFDNQREVVKNERRQTYENRPYGMAHWNMQEQLFPSPHPYNWMTIGSQEDLNAASLEDVKDFFRKYYSASNASLAIAGDFDPSQCIEMVNKYFSTLPSGISNDKYTKFDSSLSGRVELYMPDNVSLPKLYIGWPTPPHLDKTEPILDILSLILADGRNSRLYNRLVYPNIAQSVSAYAHGSEIAGQFFIEVTAAPGKDLKDIEMIVDEEIERIISEPPTDEEMEISLNKIEYYNYSQMSKIGGFGGRADLLNHYNVFANDPNYINTFVEEYSKVTKESIVKTTATILNENQVRLRAQPNSIWVPVENDLDRTIEPTPTKEEPFNPPVHQSETLDNGLEVIYVKKEGLPLVSCGLLIKTGSTVDPEHLPGLMYFTTLLSREGTDNRNSSQIYNDLDKLGASIGIETRREYIFYSTEVVTKHIGPVLDILSDIVLNPTYPIDEIKRIKSKQLGDLKRSYDEPNAIADRIFPQLIYGNSAAYGHPTSGNESSIENFSQNDLIELNAEVFKPADAQVIVVGDIDFLDIKNQVIKYFGQWNQEPRNEVRDNNKKQVNRLSSYAAGIYIYDKPDSAQSVIRAGHTLFARNDKDYFSMNLVNFVFGGQFSSRLNLNLREEKGYSYGFHSGVSWFKQDSLLIAGGGVQTDKTTESVIEILKEFKGIVGKNVITDIELDDAKNQLLLGYPAGFERSGQILDNLVQLSVHDLDDNYFQEVPNNLKSVSLDDANRVAKEHINIEALKLFIVGDKKIILPGLMNVGLPVFTVDHNGTVSEL